MIRWGEWDLNPRSLGLSLIAVPSQVS